MIHLRRHQQVQRSIKRRVRTLSKRRKYTGGNDELFASIKRSLDPSVLGNPRLESLCRDTPEVVNELKDGEHPLLYAIRGYKRNIYPIQVLMKTSTGKGVPVITDKDVLHQAVLYAIEEEYYDIFELLLDLGPKDISYLLVKDDKGNTLLHKIINHVELGDISSYLKLIIHKLRDSSKLTSFLSDGNIERDMVIHFLVEEGLYECVKILLAHGVDPNTTTSVGTLLDTAIEQLYSKCTVRQPITVDHKDYYTTIAILLCNGATSNPNSHVLPPLHVAAKNDDIVLFNLCRLFLSDMRFKYEYSNEIPISTEGVGNTPYGTMNPIEYGCATDNYEVVDMLLLMNMYDPLFSLGVRCLQRLRVIINNTIINYLKDMGDGGKHVITMTDKCHKKMNARNLLLEESINKGKQLDTYRQKLYSLIDKRDRLMKDTKGTGSGMIDRDRIKSKRQKTMGDELDSVSKNIKDMEKQMEKTTKDISICKRDADHIYKEVRKDFIALEKNVRDLLPVESSIRGTIINHIRLHGGETVVYPKGDTDEYTSMMRAQEMDEEEDRQKKLMKSIDISDHIHKDQLLDVRTPPGKKVTSSTPDYKE